MLPLNDKSHKALLNLKADKSEALELQPPLKYTARHAPEPFAIRYVCSLCHRGARLAHVKVHSSTGSARESSSPLQRQLHDRQRSPLGCLERLAHCPRDNLVDRPRRGAGNIRGYRARADVDHLNVLPQQDISLISALLMHCCHGGCCGEMLSA
jgi:hypothetical protein